MEDSDIGVFIRRGGILLAPLAKYDNHKYQYILKCDQCNEICNSIGSFVLHCLDHDEKLKAETKVARRKAAHPTEVPIAENYEDPLKLIKHNSDHEDENVSENDYTEITDYALEVKINHESSDELDMSLVKEEELITDSQSLNDEHENQVDHENEEEQECEEEDENDEEYNDMNDNKNAYGTRQKRTNHYDGDYEEEMIDDEEEEEELLVPKSRKGRTKSKNTDDVEDEPENKPFPHKKQMIFVQDFMRNRSHVVALLAAYEKHPQLWKLDKTARLKKADRELHLRQIAEEMENANIPMTNTSQIEEILRSLRSSYRNYINHFDPNDRKGEKRKTPWYAKYLEFMRPCMEMTITRINEQYSKLSPQQIVQILGIYKKYPHLWNTDLVEYVCNNKRLEALQDMQQILEKEMGMEVDIESLKRYVYNLHMYCSREKRLLVEKLCEQSDICKYYKHMSFLVDHCGPSSCSACGKKFKGVFVLKIHHSTHHENETNLKRLQCSVCHKVYKKQEPYVAHARKHMKDFKHECKECGRQFIRAADLQIHTRYHTGEMPYCCEICGHNVKCAQELTTHRRRHNKEYVHYCQECSQGFYTKNLLTNHMRMKHIKKREFVCDTCGKGFTTKIYLTRHKAIHLQGINHFCKLCGKGYKNKAGIYHHMRTHRRTDVLTKKYLEREDEEMLEDI
uniref:Uncharacterized protein n=1 Tax=Stomoxys calcitrans TaxID=35570 RepID=A0A1I8PJ11_STOCA